MKIQNIGFFVFASVISLLAASYRWGDSAHSIGLIKARGGEAKHPSFLESGKGSYTMIVTATVIPPYQGDARVVLEGEPQVDYRLYLSNPVIDLEMRRHPEMKGDIIYGLQPRDRIALWLVMKPPFIDPVCGMAYEERFLKHTYRGKDYYLCSEGCLNSFKDEPERYRNRDGVRGRYTLAFYDIRTGKSVLNVPVIFRLKGEAKDACEHQH